MSVFCIDDATIRELFHFGMDFDSVFSWGGFFPLFIFPPPFLSN